MVEFGHQYANGNGCFMDSWSAGPFIINVAGRDYHFEDSDRFGPALLKRDGELRANPWPAEKHPFWDAHAVWVAAGRPLQSDGVHCVFDPYEVTK